MTTTKSRAKEKAARIQRQRERDLEDKEQARREKAEKTARLRELRLAGEAAGKTADGEPAAAKKPPGLPWAHRRG